MNRSSDDQSHNQRMRTRNGLVPGHDARARATTIAVLLCAGPGVLFGDRRGRNRADHVRRVLECRHPVHRTEATQARLSNVATETHVLIQSRGGAARPRQAVGYHRPQHLSARSPQ